MSRYVIMHDMDTRPGLLVETWDRVTPERIASFKEELYGRGCAHGLILDDKTAVVLRDTFWKMSVDSIGEEARIPTNLLLHRAEGASLDARVEDWLARMAASWNEALPEDPDAVAALLLDVVPALAGSSIRAA